ncbi:hypothetical protein K435DRAFT_838443 [Dendrothele bispora CBS 962.96]|uniref:Dihydroorotate dehydrogenase (quinone), mitochondrial n=1 Tax=Dendrothele bispora (strain CBS 962.96) TaxID=1314807 RepID=A0A4S8M662_DENBC|nr:hypothetical protein K435DRAFT_838443 [Dendrothele bispora CBS 962.96]
MAALRQAARRTLFTSNHHRTLFTKAATPSPLRTGVYATALLLSTGLFAVYYFDARSAIHRYVLTPVLRYAFDAETGHQIAVKVLRSGLGPRDPQQDDQRLKFELWGKTVSNPIGLAAGFDKDGEAIDGLLDLGFSWVEIGSITPQPQPGNPKPRVFHLTEDSALINRYGFPSQGHSTVLSRIRARIPAWLSGENPNASLRDGSLLAVNLGKNKTSPADSIDDFVAGVRTFGPYSDVLVINVSSPNTPGLRGLQNKASLEALLSGVTKARDSLPNSLLTATRPRLVLKIAPDLNESQLEDIAEVIRGSSIDGIIVSNTSVQRPASLVSANRIETGGLSGAPIKPLTLTALTILRSRLPSNIPLIGCGGISSGDDALEYAQAGASMVQVYTHFGYGGAGTCRRIKDEIVEKLQKEGKSWGEIVGKAVEEKSWKKPKVEKKAHTVGQLIAEAEELKKLLDQLGERMGAEVKDVEDSAVAAAQPAV